jgi:hypothetical protein
MGAEERAQLLAGWRDALACARNLAGARNLGASGM